jgi:hypothetical protein
MFEFKSKLSFHLMSNTSQGEHAWKPQIPPYNYVNINSQYERSRQIRILENLSDFSKPV